MIPLQQQSLSSPTLSYNSVSSHLSRNKDANSLNLYSQTRRACTHTSCSSSSASFSRAALSFRSRTTSHACFASYSRASPRADRVLRAQQTDSDPLRPSREDLPDHNALLELLKERSSAKGEGAGQVYLVGTGPGDPDLLTMSAYKLMQTADVVLYDRLVSDDILRLVSDEARMVYVGKKSGYHTRTQEEIHELLQQFAEAGATVLRLKGGDPSVFGRGGEEMEFLRKLGINVSIVPGISASQGIGAELGIPLTFRGIADSVTFLTGHSKDGNGDPVSSIEQLANPMTTLVIYMGLQTLPIISETLLHPPATSPHPPLDPLTPCAAIQKGTTPEQRVVFAPLGEISEAVKEAELISPTLVIIGNVVKMSPLYPGEGQTAVLDPADVYGGLERPMPTWGAPSAQRASEADATTI